jgi:hypothetical protein
MSKLKLPNWKKVEETLYEESYSIITDFSKKHPEKLCSFFAYGIGEQNGNFWLNFDTYENSITEAKKREVTKVEMRNQYLKGKDAWKQASSFLERAWLTPYNSSVSNFAFNPYNLVHFDGWDIYQDEEEQLPQADDYDDPYLVGNIRLVVSRVIDKLIQNDVFARIKMTQPFCIGYQFQEGLLVILRIINWPSSLETEL